MAQDITKINLPGPCLITVDGTDVGHTPQEGVTATFAGEFVRAMVAKHGPTPARTWIKGQTLEVEFELSQTEKDNLVLVLPNSALVISGGDSKLTFGYIAGTPIPAVELVMTPTLSGQDPDQRLTIHKAVPVGDFKQVYNAEGEQRWACKFEAQVNEATGSDGSYLATIGDPSITPDVTPPTVTTIVPASNATGVSRSTAIIWTMSKELDPDTVKGPGEAKPQTVFVTSDPTGTPLAVAGTVALVNNGSSTTINFTPSSDLAALTAINSYLSGSIKDKAGNALAAYTKDFTTGA